MWVAESVRPGLLLKFKSFERLLRSLVSDDYLFISTTCLEYRELFGLIAKIRFFGQNSAQSLGSRVGSRQELPMRGIDQTCKHVALALALVSGALVLLPTAASAQFDIGGIIGAFGHRYGGYHSGHSSSSHHAKSQSSKRDSSDKDAADQDSSDQDAKADIKSDSKPSRRQTSAPAPARDNSQSAATDTPPPVKVVPTKTNGDEPAFSPSR
jgi:hypothetical protein